MTNHPEAEKPSNTSASAPQTSAAETPCPTGEPGAGTGPAGQAKIASNELLSDNSTFGLESQRRVHERLPFVAFLTVHHIDSNDNISAGLRCPAIDISVGGLCFRSRRSYWKGDRLLVLIQTKDGSTRIVFAAVRHCAYDGGGNHRVGVQFIESPKSKRILSWLAENVVE